MQYIFALVPNADLSLTFGTVASSSKHICPSTVVVFNLARLHMMYVHVVCIASLNRFD
jgi:hypothetical protein